MPIQQPETTPQSPAPTATFPLSFQHGHPLLVLDGREFLLDTGCPFSFGEGPAPTLLGEPVQLMGPQGLLGFNLQAVRTLADRATGLLGMDVLGRHQWEFDAAAGQVRLSTGPSAPGGTPLPITLAPMGGAPILKGARNGRETRILFDSGAQLSYRVGAPEGGPGPVGEEQDYNPHLGAFTTPVWEDRLQVGGRDLPVRYGKLPQLAELTLAMVGVDWVIGRDFLLAFRFRLDVGAGELVLLP